MVRQFPKRYPKGIKKLSKSYQKQKSIKNPSKIYPKGIQKPSKTRRGQKPLKIFTKRCQKPIQFQKGIKKLSNISSKSCQKYIKFSVFTGSCQLFEPRPRPKAMSNMSRQFSERSKFLLEGPKQYARQFSDRG